MTNKKVIQSENNASIQPGDRCPIIIGYVEEVNGPGAVEIPAFVPTRHELVQLVRYWEQVWLQDMFWMYWSHTVGSSECRLTAFARDRVRRIADEIGDAVAKAAIDEVWADFGKHQEPRTWKRFCKGLPAPPMRG